MPTTFKTRIFAAVIIALLLATAASAQEYSIRANRGLNLRAEPSRYADIAGTVRKGDVLQVVGQSGSWLKIKRRVGNAWLADWVNYSRVQQPTSETETSSTIDNCCFVDRGCQSDQDWIDGYWAYQNKQCPQPAGAQANSSTPQPTAGAQPSAIDNCCYAGWACHSDEQWHNGYWAYQNNQCDSPAPVTGPVDNCCQLGWNCQFEFDWIMGGWWYNDATCNQPLQELVDGVILEGSPAFINQSKRAMQLLKSKAPEWHAYVTNIILKIRESQPATGYGTLNRSFNLPVWHSVAYAAAIIIHETCHVHRSFAGVHTHEYENIAEEPICDQLSIETLQLYSPGTAYPRGRIDDYFAQGHTWDYAPSVRREWDRAHHIYAQLG